MRLRERLARMMASGNPLAQVLGVVLMALLLAGALIIGAVAGVVLIGIALVTAATFGVRLWWMRRKLRQGGAVNPPPPGSAGRGAPPREGNVIEAEYHVIEERREGDR